MQTTNLALRWVVLCAAECGLRFAMACRIRPCDLENGRVRLLGKWGKTTDVPASQRMLALLATLHAPNPQARMIDLLHGHPISCPNSTIHNAWAAWKRKAGIRPEVRLHDLRRGLAHAMWNQTKDLHAVQLLLGHAKVESTLAYLHAYATPLTADQMSAAIASNLTSKGHTK